MRFLIFGLGSAGDVHPNVGLCLHLRARGHQVQLIAAPVFRSLAERLGLAFDALGTEEDFQAAQKDPDLWQPMRAFYVVARRLIIPAIRPIFEYIADRYIPGETVVAAPATAFGARIAQEKLGVPLATIHLQPAMMRSYRETPVYGHPDLSALLPGLFKRFYFRMVDRWVIDRVLAPSTNTFRGELGLAPVRRLFDLWNHSPQLVLGLFPPWFAAQQPDWPPNTHLTGFPLYDESGVREVSPALGNFLDSGTPPIIFTPGSANLQGKEYFAVASELCRQRGWRALLLTQHPEQLPPQLPENVQHFNYVPFSQVLSRAAAFVHHGGIGTVAQALAAGVPQLVVPLAHDQFDNAERVRRLDCGRKLLLKDFRVQGAGDVLEGLLSSSKIRERCAHFAQRLQGQHALDAACNLLEGLAADRVRAAHADESADGP